MQFLRCAARLLNVIAIVLSLLSWGAARAASGERDKPKPGAAASSAPAPERRAPSNNDCLECHGDRDSVDDPRYLVDPASLAIGPHAENEVSCVNCHTKAASVEDISDHGKLGPASCNSCHEDAVAAMTKGAHAVTRKLPGKKLPTCSTCHGAHGIRSIDDPASPVYRTQQPRLCVRCHAGKVFDNFVESVHGKALLSVVGQANQPKRKAPSCWSCHGGHTIESADVERNPRFKLAMVKKCSGCHEGPATAYADSIHGVALLQRDQLESASCVDCHRGHEIFRPEDPRSAVYATKVMEDCSKCHADEKLIRRFNLPSQVVKSYELSYHGLANHEGDTRVANCATCHRYHAIYPQHDKRSSVYPGNLKKTCGKCHPEASANFIAGKIHVQIGSQDNYATWVVKMIYMWLIGIVIGGMFLHNILDFVRKMLLRVQKAAREAYVERMLPVERISHIALIISFVTLAYSGFALLYPDSWWAAPLRWVSDTEVFRKTVHRVAAVALVLVALHHLWFLFFHRRGREQRIELRPRLRDFRELVQNVLFYLGKRKAPPAFSRFSYMEKAEYWALVWGTAVMAATGGVMWFQEVALRYIPRWLFNVCAAIHLYEAILAVLAIVVWHFYFVFINPDEAPMATTWLTGRMSAKHVKHQHATEYEQLDRAGDIRPGDSPRSSED